MAYGFKRTCLSIIGVAVSNGSDLSFSTVSTGVDRMLCCGSLPSSGISSDNLEGDDEEDTVASSTSSESIIRLATLGVGGRFGQKLSLLATIILSSLSLNEELLSWLIVVPPFILIWILGIREEPDALGGVILPPKIVAILSSSFAAKGNDNKTIDC